MFRVHCLAFTLFCCSFIWAQSFTDVTASSGIGHTHQDIGICLWDVGTGSAWGDYDNDGDPDLYVTNHGGPNWLYRNDGDSSGDGVTDFVDVAVTLGVDDPLGISHSAAFIDYDNDGDQDLYVTNYGEGVSRLYHNLLVENGSVGFIDLAQSAGLTDGGRPITAGWADFDNDGWLDVYIAKHAYCPEDARAQDVLYKNNGDGTFSDVSGWLCAGGSAPCAQLNGLGFTPGWFDYDNDGDLDLYLVNDNIDHLWYTNVLWRNDGPDGAGGWIFTDISDLSASGLDVNGMGLGIGDYNNDGWMDLAFSNIGPNMLLRNNPNGVFDNVAEEAGVMREVLPSGHQSFTWGTLFLDADNDRWLDLYIVAGTIGETIIPQPNILFMNNHDGTFRDASAESNMANTLRARNASSADIDGDGDVDIFVSNIYQPPILHMNETDGGNWFSVTVEGTESNRDAIGTRMWLESPDGLTQMRDINSGPTHGGGDYRAGYFGLADQVEGELTVRWPNGVTTNYGTFAANQAVHLVEPSAFAVELEIHPKYETISAAGDTLPVRMTFVNSGAAGTTIDLWMELELPDGSKRSIISPKTASIPGGTDSRRSAIVEIAAGDPAGEFIATLYWGEAGSFPGDTLGVSSVSINKSALALAGEADAQDLIIYDNLLEQNYPNPFNPTTSIRYSLRLSSLVHLTVYDVSGRKVRQLAASAEQAAGSYELTWDGTNDSGAPVASGVYIYRLIAYPNNNVNAMPYTETRKLMLTR